MIIGEMFNCRRLWLACRSGGGGRSPLGKGPAVGAGVVKAAFDGLPLIDAGGVLNDCVFVVFKLKTFPIGTVWYRVPAEGEEAEVRDGLLWLFEWSRSWLIEQDEVHPAEEDVGNMRLE